MSDYRIEYYRNSRTGREPVREYISELRPKEKSKIYQQLEVLLESNGRVVMPYGRHIDGKIWELRVQFSPLAHRILYVCVQHKTIVLLHAFTKKTEKLPRRELERAYNNYSDTLDNIKYYYEKTN